MLPQNGLQRPPNSNGNGSGNPMGFDGVDPNSTIGKQMAALSASHQFRMRSGPMAGGGTSSAPFLGPSNSNLPSNIHASGNSPDISLPNLSMQTNAGGQPFRNGAPHDQITPQKAALVRGITQTALSRGVHLPPAFSGIQDPNYNPATSPFAWLEIVDIGVIRLGGKDVDIIKLFNLVFSRGGYNKFSNENAWPGLLSAFDLPEDSPQPFPNGTTNIPAVLQSLYNALLTPFEQIYHQNLRANQQKAMNTRQGQQPPPATPQRQGSQPPPGVFPRSNMPGTPGSPSFPQTSPTIHPPDSTMQMPSLDTRSHIGADILSHSLDNDSDPAALKRKSDAEDGDGKRTRQRTDPLDSATASASPKIVNGTTAAVRRKIEYVPFAREVESSGGRDLRMLEAEPKRPLRDLSEWGTVDIDALMLSIRSRISIELSYALTTFTLLSTMKGSQPNSGFPLHQATDLLDEVIDLLEDLAFGDEADWFTPHSLDSDPAIPTMRQMQDEVQNRDEFDPFSCLQPQQGDKDRSLGPIQRPGNLILAIINLFRNLAYIPSNAEVLSRRPRILTLVLRICSLDPTSKSLRPACSTLSLQDLLLLRKDVLCLLGNLAPSVVFPGDEVQAMGVAYRIFHLVASCLVDPSEAVHPTQITYPPKSKPPSLADMALDVFSRISLPDQSRRLFSKAVPRATLWRVMDSLTHRLPVVEADFNVMLREQWIVYLERILMSLYSIIFMASPEFKVKVKQDRALGFPMMMLRLVRRMSLANSALFNGQQKNWFTISVRRAVETMKMVDTAADCFDVRQTSTGPALSFGMGFGEGGDGASERGNGILVGRMDVLWDVLTARDVLEDEVIFGELESLARVET